MSNLSARAVLMLFSLSADTAHQQSAVQRWWQYRRRRASAVRDPQLWRQRAEDTARVQMEQQASLRRRSRVVARQQAR